VYDPPLLLGAVWFSGYPLDDSGYPFFGGYPLFGLERGGNRDNHFCLKMMVEHIPPNLLDELNHFWLASIASPEPFYS
jgi:hypothetical protein